MMTFLQLNSLGRWILGFHWLTVAIHPTIVLALKCEVGMEINGRVQVSKQDQFLQFVEMVRKLCIGKGNFVIVWSGLF